MAPGGAAVDMTLDGNSTSAGAGYILMSSGTITLAGGPNITLSQNGNAVSISGGAGAGATAISGISASDTVYTSGTVDLTGSGGGITVGSAPGQKVVLSVAAPVAQTNQTANVIDMTLAGNTAGALALMSSGTVTLAGGNGITLSQAGNAVTISGSTFSQSSQPQSNQAGSVYAVSNTSGTSSGTYDARTLSIAGAGIVTVAASNSGWRINASQSAQAGSVYAASNTTGTSSGTYDARTLSIAGDGIISVAASNSGFRISATQSVQTQSRFDMTLAGNSTSAGAGFIEMSSGTVTLAGGNNITISQNGNALTISGPNVGGAQTGISGVVASDATYTSGTVTLTGVGGGVTVKSNTGQRVDISVAAPVAQTNQAGSVYASSNTFGTSSGTYDARTLSLAGSGAVSVAASDSGWVISAPVQSAQTAISGISASDTVYTSGTVKFTGVGGGVTVSSNTGQRVDISVAAPVAQTNQAGSVYAASNTSGTSSGTYDARTLSIAGAGIVTVAASNSGWRIDASQSNQAGSVYASSNTFGTSSGTYDARSLSIAGAGIISVAASNSGWVISASAAQTNQSGNVYASSNTFGTSSGTYDARSISIAGSGAVGVAASNSGWVISAPTQTVQTQDVLSIGASTGGNTAGNTTVNTGSRLVFVGSDLITVSQGTAAGATTLTLDATNQNLSVGASTGGNTAGNTTVNTGSRLVFVGSNNITVSQGTAAGATTLTLSGPTTAAQTNQAGSVYAISNTQGTSSGTYDARTLSIAGEGIITVAASNSGWRISASQSVQTQDVLSVGASTGGNTAGNTTVNTGSRLVFVGSNNITVSQGTAAGATTLTLSGPTQTNQAGSVYASSNTFGTSSGTYDARTLSIAGSGNVSVAASNSGWVVSVPAQTNQSGNVYASSNTFGTSSGTYDARSISLAGRGNIQIAASNSGWIVSGPVATLSGNSTSGGGGYIALSSGTIALAGGPNITLSQDGNSVSISAAPAGGAGQFSGGVSTGGNTAGATGITGTQMVLVGTNMVSLSQTTGANGGTVSINATNQNLSIGASTGGATSGDTTVNSGSRFVLVGTNLTMSQGTAAGATTMTVSAPATSSLSATGEVQISTNGSTISIGVPAPLMSFREPGGPLLMAATQGIGASAATRTTVTAWVMPMSQPRDIAFNNLYVAVHNSFSSATTSISSVTYSFSQGASLGFYTLTGSTLSLVTSFSGSLGYSNMASNNANNFSASVKYGIGGSSTGAATSTAGNLGNLMSSISSVRKMGLNWTTISNTLTRGQYWVVGCFSALTGGANQASLSQVGFVSGSSIMGSAINPPEILKSTASVTSPYPFLGLATIVNSSNSLMPPSIETSVITTATAIANSSNFQSLWFQMYSSHSN